MYVMVRSPEEEFPFYLDEFGLERFPLYWYSEPVQILGMSKVNEQNALMIDILDEYISLRKVLAIGKLLKWEKERESVFEYLETTTGGLKNYFKEKSEREFSASNVVKIEKWSMCYGKEISLQEVKNITEKQRKLHGYVGEEDLMSIWSEHYPISVVAEEHFQSKTDFELMETVDDITRAQFMYMLPVCFCLGRYEELKARREVDKGEEEGKEVQKALEFERKLRKLQVPTYQLAIREKEIEEMKTDVEKLKGKLQRLEKDKTQLEARVAELCVERKELE
ncbi:hypothetical protein PIB30_060245 [Stylosanthes scabra]|uniref:Uncharacterized protein n=1 Tax=Stylosanthes scabra TaxID=79078 RepID=A0ABU6YIQ4_9FABA|nr:hypothetical protein [Stylosanthes scabra]